MTESRRVEISVIIASYRRREKLVRCLQGLISQTLEPSRFEVIVALDGDEDGSAEAVEALESALQLRLLTLPHRGKSSTCNAAIAVAAGSSCLFLDDDMLVAPEMVAAHLEAQSGPRPVLGIGALTQRAAPDADWLADLFYRSWEEHRAELGGRRAGWTDCYGANFSAPTEALQEIGGFSDQLASAEDFDIALRLSEWGCEATYVPAATGFHDDQKSGAQLLAEIRRTGPAHVAIVDRFPETEPVLLNWSEGADGRELALRRLCLGLRLPPGLLARLGPLLPGEDQRTFWLHFVWRLAFWSGVRSHLSRRRWAALTRFPEGANTAALTMSLVTQMIEASL